MERAVHGEFKFMRTGQIIVITFAGTWNLECAQFFFSQYTAFVSQSGLRRFAVISDLLSLEGATPEALEYFVRVTEWGLKNGQVARALIADSGYKEFMVESIDKNERPFPARVFGRQDDALPWLQTLGLEVQ